MFAVKKYGDALDKMAQDKKIDVQHTTNLIKIDKDTRIATFKNLKTNQETKQKFEAMHVTPYMSPPEEIKSSPLADNTGFIEVDKTTLQHVKFPNVFAMGTFRM
jgi:NADPH-dependent 2,4-dienoyl-CoA reductase/sulfur reductase-like enzyme